MIGRRLPGGVGTTADVVIDTAILCDSAVLKLPDSFHGYEHFC